MILIKNGKFFQISGNSREYNAEDILNAGREVAEILSVPFYTVEKYARKIVINRPVCSISDLEAVPAKTLDRRNTVKTILSVTAIIAASVILLYNIKSIITAVKQIIE